jgi:hypothetical protein
MKMVVSLGLDLIDSSLDKNEVSIEFDDDDIHGTNLIVSFDALLSPLLDPLEGPSTFEFRKVGT